VSSSHFSLLLRDDAALPLDFVFLPGGADGEDFTVFLRCFLPVITLSNMARHDPDTGMLVIHRMNGANIVSGLYR